MSITPLLRIFPVAYDDDHVVAYRKADVLTFAMLRADVAAAAHGLRRADCQRGALVCRDSYWFVVGLLALMQVKADIVLPANAQPGTLAELAGSYDTVVTDDPSLAAPLFLLPQAPQAAPATLAPIDAAVSRLELFTSGSTGRSKKIVRTLSQLEAEVATLDRLWGAALGNAVAFTTVPHQHIYGMTFKMLWPLMTGRAFCALTHDLWEGLLADLSAGAVVVSSPAHLTRQGGLSPMPAARRPRMVLSAGGPLPLSAAQDTERLFGVLPTEIYGSTETGAIATRRQTGADVPWQALPGNQIRVDEEGRLALRSPYVDPNGWFKTDDRAELHPDGGFTLLGRLDSVAKIEGKRISLTEIVRALEALPLVAAAEVTILRDGRDVLAAAVVLSDAGRAALATMGAFRFTRLLRHQLVGTREAVGLPRRWRFVEELPVGPMGKRPAHAIAALFSERNGG